LSARTHILTVLLLAAGASTVGCAQCQQDPDSLAAAALDERLFTRIASILGEQSPDAVSQDRRLPSPRELDIASPPRPSRRVASKSMTPVQQVAAAEALEAAAPMPEAEPIENAPSPVAPAEPVEAPAEPRIAADATAQTANSDDNHAAACDDVCCQPGFTCPFDRPCPILGACRGCPACLAGRRCAKLFTRPEPGPPPIRYRPAMPPKFLPVPTQPVLSPARPEAPDPWRGDVEFSWRPEVWFPGRD